MAYKVPDLHHKDCAKLLVVAMAAGDERRAALEELAAFKSRVANLLRQIEWSRHIEGTGAPNFDPEWDLCDFCEAVKPGPHNEGCRLWDVLKECVS